MYVLFHCLYCFFFPLCSCSLMLPLLCLFYLSFSSHIPPYTQYDVINFQSHSVPLTNTLVCLWKIRGVCFYSVSILSLLRSYSYLNGFLYYFTKDLWKVWSYKSESRFSNKKVHPAGTLWPGSMGLILFQVSKYVEVKRECAEQKL